MKAVCRNANPEVVSAGKVPHCKVRASYYEAWMSVVLSFVRDGDATTSLTLSSDEARALAADLVRHADEADAGWAEFVQSDKASRVAAGVD
jgi:hypothetical protein